MQIIYWAHSYRDEDAAINRHFGILIEQAERMIVNFDPPSKSVNAAKLDQNLRACDGMVAVLSWRASGPSHRNRVHGEVGRRGVERMEEIQQRRRRRGRGEAGHCRVSGGAKE